jgi:hypothetical protein
MGMINERFSIEETKQHVKSRYNWYVDDYKKYLKLRGYGNHLHDWLFVKRGFLECWLAPGFHRFWQVWNPGIGYFTYRFYLRLGGKERQNLATILVFFLNGLIHNLVVSLFFWRWSFPLPFTFLSFGIFAVIFRELARYVQFERIPKFIHLVINVGLVILSFDFGFFMAENVQLASLITRLM